ncbi:T9SS type A sorting domain-containing protein [uncultured Microscilla sp.]|uniref:T9SS type A sorting domain-containing protein n=1 Tax=uncultured Microscilla sp. TaxID=432653 RepID=UPI00262A456A|nr:T9SS type A sorting domain-containing protein [uncultured Microscilla sp.]
MKLHFIYLRIDYIITTKLIASILLITQALGVAQNPIGWQKLGNKIKGSLGNENAGKTVAMSADGLTVVMGSPDYDQKGNDRGRVVVYAWSKGKNDWQQKGKPIIGEARVDQAGRTLAISGNGTRLIVGAPGNDGNGESSGHARVYQWDDLTQAWQQLGAAIEGIRFGDRAGYSVDIAANGNVVAVAARLHNGKNGSNSGHTRLFEWNETKENWQLLGTAIDGEAASDGVSDYAIALSANGQRVAIGVSANDGGGTNSGHTRIFEWDKTSSNWRQLGADVDGAARGDLSGYAVDLSADGTVVAIGSPANDDQGSNSGHTRIYKWNGALWKLLGSPITGEAARDNAGAAVALSANGLTVVVGAPENDGSGEDSGQVRVYEWSNTVAGWVQLAGDIDGDTAGDFLGNSVAVSADGTIVTTGVPFSDDIGLNNGALLVYRLMNPALATSFHSFKVQQTNAQMVSLSWIVTAAHYLKGFMIEASYDGHSFDAVGFVPIRQDGQPYYQYQLPTSRGKYYRIRQMSQQGGGQVSQWQTLTATPYAYIMQLSPNPCQGKVSLRVNLPGKSFKLMVYNLHGVALLSAQGDLLALNQQLNSGLSQWKNGVYLCRIISQKQVIQQRLVLSR